MGLTLLEASKLEQDPARLAVISELAEGELMANVPFMSISGPGVDYGVESELPAVGFRAFNESYPETYGVINPQYERLKIFGGDIDVDLAKIRMSGEQAKLDQIQMKIRSMRLTFEDLFINGNESVDPRQFDGLRTRINSGSSQAISMGGALSLARLDELIDAVDAGSSEKVLIMNKTMRRRLTVAARNTSIGGFITYELDGFGRRVTRYGDTRIIVTDTNAQNVAIQPFTEAASSTSIYCVAFGDMQTTALQHSNGIIVDQLGQVDDAPVDRTRIEWYVGEAVFNGRTAARLFGVTDAAVVA
jgi:hypothetical protein